MVSSYSCFRDLTIICFCISFMALSCFSSLAIYCSVIAALPTGFSIISLSEGSSGSCTSLLSRVVDVVALPDLLIGGLSSLPVVGVLINIYYFYFYCGSDCA